jgi:transposase
MLPRTKRPCYLARTITSHRRPSAAVRLMRRVRESGTAAPAGFGGPRHPVLDPHKSLICSLLEAKPDITLVELRTELARHGVVVRAPSIILRWFRRARLTRKMTP